MTKFPVWRMPDRSLQLSKPERDGAAERGVVEYEIEAETWEEANVEFNITEPRGGPPSVFPCQTVGCRRQSRRNSTMCVVCYAVLSADPEALR